MQYDDNVPSINVFETTTRIIDLPLASIGPRIPDFVDRPYQNQKGYIAETFHGHFANYLMSRDVNALYQVHTTLTEVIGN